ncbi:hypothetical protein DXG01_009873 [Tephrocybe rancida]|nr:hypothetical protein DXG01_009873 [Tephrocybe rancida]
MSSNAHTAGNQHPPSCSAPKSSKRKAQGPPPPPPDVFAPPCIVLPDPTSRTAKGMWSIRDEEDYDLGEDKVDESGDDVPDGSGGGGGDK